MIENLHNSNEVTIKEYVGLREVVTGLFFLLHSHGINLTEISKLGEECDAIEREFKANSDIATAIERAKEVKAKMLAIARTHKDEIHEKLLTEANLKKTYAEKMADILTRRPAGFRSIFQDPEN